MGKEFAKETLALEALISNRQALIVAEIAVFVFSLAAAPFFFLNRREKIGVAAVLLAGGTSLLMAIGFLFDRIYLPPALKKQRGVVESFSPSDSQIYDVHVAAEVLSKFMERERSHLAPGALQEAELALTEVQDLKVRFTPPSWKPPKEEDG